MIQVGHTAKHKTCLRDDQVRGRGGRRTFFVRGIVIGQHRRRSAKKLVRIAVVAGQLDDALGHGGHGGHGGHHRHHRHGWLLCTHLEGGVANGRGVAGAFAGAECVQALKKCETNVVTQTCYNDSQPKVIKCIKWIKWICFESLVLRTFFQAVSHCYAFA